MDTDNSDNGPDIITKENTSLKIDYFDNNVEKIDNLLPLDFINVVTSVFYDKVTCSSTIRQKICHNSLWLKGRSNRHTVLYTDNLGELSEEETNVETEFKKESVVDIEPGQSTGRWINGVRPLSPSVIQPAPLWWERGPEVMTYIPPTTETSIEDHVREELGQGTKELGQGTKELGQVKEELGGEFPYALGKQVEELMADHWETMRKKGQVGRIEDCRSQFNKMVANAQLDLLKLSEAFYKQRCEQEDPNCPLDVKAAFFEAFQSPYIIDSDSLITTSDESDSNEEEDVKDQDTKEAQKMLKKGTSHQYMTEYLETSSDENSDTPNKQSPCSPTELSGSIEIEPNSSPIVKIASPSVKSSPRCRSFLSPRKRSRKRLHSDYSPESPVKKPKLGPVSEI